MENRDDVQLEPRSRVDASLVSEVITLTKDVNKNLGAMITHTDKLISRQNVLIGLCLATVICLAAMVVADYQAQKAQELIARQMNMLNFHMLDVAMVKTKLGKDILKMEEREAAIAIPDAGAGK